MNKILTGLIITLFSISNALAHQPSTAYLKIDASQETLSGSWDIPLIDLQLALNLDTDQDQNLRWGEVVAASEKILTLTDNQIAVLVDEKNCDLSYNNPLANQINGDGYLHLAWTASCLAANPLSLNYQLFSELNVNHRALLEIDTADTSQSYVVRSGSENQDFADQGFISYFHEGVIHIWIGYDHLLFLLILLLPLIAANWKQSIRRSLWLITAFTAAHSLSLIIVTLGNLSLPIKLVELSISLSIVGAAGLLVWKPSHNASAVLALGLGLLHGLGFANVLRELLANGDNLALHLLGFNLGVEAGQLVIAAATIPLLILSQQWFNYALVVRCLALASLATALFWTLERL